MELPSSVTCSSVKEWRALLTQSHHHSYGLYENNCLIAFVVFSLVLGEGEIILILTDPNHARKGHATSLLKKIKAQADMIYLEVAENNEKVIKFYAKPGFTQIGIRPNYYQQIMQDALCLKWQK